MTFCYCLYSSVLAGGSYSVGWLSGVLLAVAEPLPPPLGGGLLSPPALPLPEVEKMEKPAPKKATRLATASLDKLRLSLDKQWIKWLMTDKGKALIFL